MYIFILRLSHKSKGELERSRGLKEILFYASRSINTDLRLLSLHYIFYSLSLVIYVPLIRQNEKY